MLQSRVLQGFFVLARTPMRVTTLRNIALNALTFPVTPNEVHFQPLLTAASCHMTHRLGMHLQWSAVMSTSSFPLGYSMPAHSV